MALWAHPRWRGEHYYLICALILWAGSSPLARGTLIKIIFLMVVGGLIPAGAGNTRLACFCRPPTGAHPRWRGEHVIVILLP